ncbi:MAG: Rrf2 family transcriptional regulator [Chitinophagaceae bacterium]|nr:Rrf2 family transcriptional regulator [Chitinophagaceae bacterium]
MISNTCKTAIRAVIYLASKRPASEKVGIVEIAKQIDVSEHTLGKILQALVRHNVINSTKGPSGGFYLTEDQTDQPIMNIVEAVDGKMAFKECGLGLSKCSENHPCPIHHIYKEGRQIIENLFKENRVKDLCLPVNEKIAYLIG